MAAGLLVAAISGQGQTAAFPGALGFGAYATGGRNGTVYHVTTLADSGTGSFRDAVSHSGRTIVFDVGGMITLNSAVSCSSSLTIAGQTAPGGICFNAGEVAFAGRNNVICRYIRIRPGSATASTGDDCLSLYQATNCILDHCSLAFGPWNNIDAVTCNNISIQHCIDANPIGQQFGAHTENVGAFYSWTYNIFANSHNRNPLAKINTVFINNVDYNCSAGYTTHTSTRFSHDVVNNYFVAGPASTSSSDFPWYQVDKNQSIYYSGNYDDANDNGTLDGSGTTPYWYQGTGTVLSSPWSSWTTVIPTLSAPLAWRYDVSTAGAFPRDDVDSLVISQVKTVGSGTTGTGTGTAGPSGALYQPDPDRPLQQRLWHHHWRHGPGQFQRRWHCGLLEAGGWFEHQYRVSVDQHRDRLHLAGELPEFSGRAARGHAIEHAGDHQPEPVCRRFFRQCGVQCDERHEWNHCLD